MTQNVNLVNVLCTCVKMYILLLGVACCKCQLGPVVW